MFTVQVKTASPLVSGVPFGRRISKTQASGLGRPGQQRREIHRRKDVLCQGLKSQDLNTDFLSRVQRMSEKYDFLSAFIGSIMVTGYFVSVHGQDIGTALGISSMATVVAVVLEEFLFNSSSS
jgi:hypothetical protein